MISNDVPSLELCKKLRDLGWKKETMFWQVELESPELRYEIHYKATWDFRLGNPTIPAPTVGEMMEAMQGTIQDHKYQLRFWKIGLCYDGYQMAYMDDDNKALFYATDVAIEMKFKTVTTELSLCEVCALTLIHLLENNLVKLEEKE